MTDLDYEVAVLTWWIVGVASILWLTRDEPLTYGRLFWIIIFGQVGLILPVITVLVIVSKARFWDYPVFGKGSKEKNNGK